VLLCFVDESFKGDFYGFAAVIADEHATKALTHELNAIVNQAAVNWGISATSEIHGYPLFHGKDDWAPIGDRARVAIFQQIVNAIVQADVTILMRAINKGRLEQRQANESYPVNFPPEQVCFQHILQRADDIARRRTTHALIIADERGDRERHRERFAMYQTRGTPGVYMHTTLDHLLDTVHFAPSHHSRMLQAADILAFVYRRVRTVSESDPRSAAAMERLWSTIQESGKLHDVGTWP
jgi:hypothetical protein